MFILETMYILKFRDSCDRSITESQLCIRCRLDTVSVIVYRAGSARLKRRDILNRVLIFGTCVIQLVLVYGK